MKKLKMARGVSFTFEEGCNKYLENCRQRNLRQGTINHYRQSYLYFYKFFDPKMPIKDIDEQTHILPLLPIQFFQHIVSFYINSYIAASWSKRDFKRPFQRFHVSKEQTPSPVV